MVVERAERGDDMFMAVLQPAAEMAIALTPSSSCPSRTRARSRRCDRSPRTKARTSPVPSSFGTRVWYFDAVSDDGAGRLPSDRVKRTRTLVCSLPACRPGEPAVMPVDGSAPLPPADDETQAVVTEMMKASHRCVQPRQRFRVEVEDRRSLRRSLGPASKERGEPVASSVAQARSTDDVNRLPVFLVKRGRVIAVSDRPALDFDPESLQRLHAAMARFHHLRDDGLGLVVGRRQRRAPINQHDRRLAGTDDAGSEQTSVRVRLPPDPMVNAQPSVVADRVEVPKLLFQSCSGPGSCELSSAGSGRSGALAPASGLGTNSRAFRSIAISAARSRTAMNMSSPRSVRSTTIAGAIVITRSRKHWRRYSSTALLP